MFRLLILGLLAACAGEPMAPQPKGPPPVTPIKSYIIREAGAQQANCIPQQATDQQQQASPTTQKNSGYLQQQQGYSNYNQYNQPQYSLRGQQGYGYNQGQTGYNQAQAQPSYQQTNQGYSAQPSQLPPCPPAVPQQRY